MVYYVVHDLNTLYMYSTICCPCAISCKMLIGFGFFPSPTERVMSCSLEFGLISSPVGNWKFEYCPLGLHRMKLSEEVTNNNFLKLGHSKVGLVGEEVDADDKLVQSLLHWMKLFFARRSSDKENCKVALPSVKLCPSVFGEEDDRQSFRQKVWQTLYSRVPFGGRVSYGELAKMSGSPGASRAVGSAMASNPISLVVPCHRVVPADGTTGNYAKKTKNDVKVWLLKHEGSI